MVSRNHSIDIYVSLRCQQTSHLPHLGKIWGTIACLNFGSSQRHSHVIVILGHCCGTSPHSTCHIFLILLPIEVILSILELGCHKLRVACSLTLANLSFCMWKVFSTPGPSPTLGSLDLLTYGTTNLWCHSRVTLVPMLFWTFLMERCATVRARALGTPSTYGDYCIVLAIWLECCPGTTLHNISDQGMVPEISQIWTITSLPYLFECNKWGIYWYKCKY